MQALVSAWERGDTMPFLFDTVTPLVFVWIRWLLNWYIEVGKLISWNVVRHWKLLSDDCEWVKWISLSQVWDLIKLADYLTQREDIDPTRVGITGESLGGLWWKILWDGNLRIHYLFLCNSKVILLFSDAGMHAWFAAAADTRYAVVVPIIGVQVLHLISLVISSPLVILNF